MKTIVRRTALALTLLALFSCGTDDTRSTLLQDKGGKDAGKGGENAPSLPEILGVNGNPDKLVMVNVDPEHNFNAQKKLIYDCGNVIRQEFSPYQIAKIRAWQKESTEKAIKLLKEHAQSCRKQLNYYAENSKYVKLKRLAAKTLLHALKTIEDPGYIKLSKKFIEEVFVKCDSFEDCEDFTYHAMGFADVQPHLLLDKERIKSWRQMFDKATEVTGAFEYLLYRLEVIQINAYFAWASGFVNPDNLGRSPSMDQRDIDHLDAWIKRVTREETFAEARKRAGLAPEPGPDDHKDPRNFWSRLVNFRDVKKGKNTVRYPGRPTLLKIKNPSVLARILRVMVLDESKIKVGFGFEHPKTRKGDIDFLVLTLTNVYRRLDVNFTHYELQQLGDYALQLMHSVYRSHYTLLGMQIYLKRFNKQDPTGFLSLANLAAKQDSYYSESFGLEPLAFWNALSRFHNVELRLPYRSLWLEKMQLVTKKLLADKEEYREKYQKQIKVLLKDDPGEYRNPRIRASEEPLDRYVARVITGQHHFLRREEDRAKSLLSAQAVLSELEAVIPNEQESPTSGNTSVRELDGPLIIKIPKPKPLSAEQKLVMKEIAQMDELAFIDLAKYQEHVNSRWKFYDVNIKEFVKRQKIDAFKDESAKGGKSTEYKERWAAKHFPQFQSLIYQQVKMESAMWSLKPLYEQYENTKAKHKRNTIAKQVKEMIPNAVTPYLRTMCYAYYLPFTVDKKYWNTVDEASLKRYVGQKPAWQKTAESPFDPGNTKYDLVKACGYDHKRVLYQVNSYLTAHHIEQEWKEFWISAGMTIGELPVIFVSAETAHMVSLPAKKYLKHFMRRYAFRTSWRKGLHKAMGKRLVAEWIRRYAIIGTAHYAFPHMIAGIIGATVFTFTQHCILATLTLKEWWASDPKQSWRNNFWENFGEDLLVGSAIFIFAPILQKHVFRRIGRRLCGFSSAEDYQAHLANFEAKMAAVRSQGASGGRVLFRHSFDWRLGTMATTQMTGDFLIFASVPFADRAIRRYLYPKDHDPIFIKEDLNSDEFSTVLGAPQVKELLGAAKVAAWFYLAQRIKKDVSKMEYKGGIGRRGGTWALKVMFFTPDMLGWRNARRVYLEDVQREVTREVLKKGEDGEMVKGQEKGKHTFEVVRDYYAEMGIERGATQQKIKNAYDQGAKERHPDRGGSAESMQRLQEAYDVLRNSSERAIYDGVLAREKAVTGRPRAIRSKLRDLKLWWKHVLLSKGASAPERAKKNPMNAARPKVYLPWNGESPNQGGDSNPTKGGDSNPAEGKE